MHFQTPLAPLTTDFHGGVHLTALSARAIYVNDYAFMTFPMPPRPTEDILKRGVLDVWQNDYMPCIRERVQKMRTTDFDSMSLAEFGNLAPQILDWTVDTFLYTMKPITGFMGPTFGLVHFLQEELGPQGPQMAASLLQGFENNTAAAGAGLSNLAEAATAHPAVAEALRAGRYENRAALEGGTEFLEVLKSIWTSSAGVPTAGVRSTRLPGPKTSASPSC